ncbi:COG1180: Radical SAM, Pyruvate-formate lyase-activating enzyme like [Olavius algarvensis associated proteobacterium Delta 3]|nr:COG1180: Radical SAM, Pyruvate-formate lyase-activating enzyme like [Olavius algarvensis associated proteobacterium Delta 3]CAB5131549.1 COG1180: Radical SAM, Pyruvate-formate lyase-activating enzyme like [Olavius algarvensis associated proteobacterium Delta 3]
MRYEGTTYRPPPEADSFLLQVTVGCAHNQCTFCHMYRDVSFRRIPMDQIEEDLREARGIYSKMERIFLVNGDAFVLKAETLASIAGKIRFYFPECRTITMYASIKDIRAKTDQELADLRRLGINDLYVGVESGWDDVLAHINKGHTIEEARHQLGRLHRAGINHIANLMLGVAGAGNGMENARLTAEFLNQTAPCLIWVGTLAIFEGTELYAEMEQGVFVSASEMEILEEEKELIRNIELDNVRFYGVHPTNAVRVSGVLPRDKQRMIDAIDNGIEGYGEEALSATFHRESL